MTSLYSRNEPVLLVSACDFGWGSLGKLRFILDELPEVRVSLDTEPRFSSTIRSMLGNRQSFAQCERDAASVGLVINDPQAANELTCCGVPVIYVDSLPYLWTIPEEVPQSVAVYCAQKAPTDLAADSPLAGRDDTIWVDSIVPRTRARSGGGGVVINVGGLHSYLAGASTDAYVSLAVMPLARLLAEASYPVAAVCGNLPRWASRDLSRLLPAETKIGPQPPHEFERTLSSADSLITSPGSTTILQAAAIGLPVSLLPPQNLSQILNIDIYSSPSMSICNWPGSVIDRTEVDSLRLGGEGRVLEYIYKQIIQAAANEAMQAIMLRQFASILREFAGGSHVPAHVSVLGFNGASQVARILRQAILAPFPSPNRTTGNEASSRGN